jgi:hypothetical protein
MARPGLNGMSVSPKEPGVTAWSYEPTPPPPLEHVVSLTMLKVTAEDPGVGSLNVSRWIVVMISADPDGGDATVVMPGGLVMSTSVVLTYAFGLAVVLSS